MWSIIAYHMAFGSGPSNDKCVLLQSEHGKAYTGLFRSCLDLDDMTAEGPSSISLSFWKMRRCHVMSRNRRELYVGAFKTGKPGIRLNCVYALRLRLFSKINKFTRYNSTNLSWTGVFGRVFDLTRKYYGMVHYRHQSTTTYSKRTCGMKEDGRKVIFYKWIMIYGVWFEAEAFLL